MQEGCDDHAEAYKRYRSADLECPQCHRFFYGQPCLDAHRMKTISGKPVGPNCPSVCSTRRKCVECLKLLRGRQEIQQHRCGHVQCRCCKEFVDIHEHKCYLQREKTPEELRQERRERRRQQPPRFRRGAAAGLQTVRSNDPSADADDDLDEPVPPLHVFFDIESMQVEGRHVPNLVVAETEFDDFVEYYGEDCIPLFLEWLDTLTLDGQRPLTVLAHNFRGYDSYPIIEECHRQKRQLEQVRNGGKVLQLTYDNEGATIRFIDSLSFFTMPLSAFPKTFGLRELKKGFFPHLFNTPDNHNYRGPMPAAEYYMPEGMNVDT